MSRDLDALSDDALIFGPEVAKLLAISLATFHERRRWRMFPIREVTPRLDRRPRWRLGDVRAYVRGSHSPMVGRRDRKSKETEFPPVSSSPGMATP